MNVCTSAGHLANFSFSFLPLFCYRILSLIAVTRRLSSSPPLSRSFTIGTSSRTLSKLSTMDFCSSCSFLASAHQTLLFTLVQPLEKIVCLFSCKFHIYSYRYPRVCEQTHPSKWWMVYH